VDELRVWVDVYASGENIVVPFPNVTYTYPDGFGADFTQGQAIWSGISFAAPVVAGMIARRNRAQYQRTGSPGCRARRGGVRSLAG
jgi:hypothetical protein